MLKYKKKEKKRRKRKIIKNHLKAGVPRAICPHHNQCPPATVDNSVVEYTRLVGWDVYLRYESHGPFHFSIIKSQINCTARRPTCIAHMAADLQHHKN